jgi:DNA-binding MarR family transcriptional regulator
VELEELGLTSAEINALAILADGRQRSVGELIAQTGSRATTLTGVLDRLERRGYVAREMDAADRRSFRVMLTEAGRVAADQVHAVITSVEHEALASLRPEQIAGFHAVLTALEEIDDA